MAGEMLGILRSRLGNQPSPERKPYLLSAILFPVGSPAHAQQGAPAMPEMLR